MVIELPDEFKEFLRLLNEHQVEYLLVGEFAVAFHGDVRSTKDIDIWVSVSSQNAKCVVDAIKEFGFEAPDLRPAIFETPGKVIRMGNPPLRIEVLTEIDGVNFNDCAANATTESLDGVPVPVISCADLKKNKRASRRFRDLDDLEHLP